MISIDKIDQKFVFILAAAKRARQLQGGAKPLIQASVRKATRVAMEEVGAGAVSFEVPPMEEHSADGKEKKPKSKARKKT